MKAKDGRKYCPKCSVTKDVGEFARSYGTNDGYQVWCRECARAYNREYQVRRRAANRAKHLGEKAGGE